MATTMRVREFKVGEIVAVKGEGVFRVVGFEPDGSLRLWGGKAWRECFRSIDPSRCRRKRKGGPVAHPELKLYAPRHKAGKR